MDNKFVNIINKRMLTTRILWGALLFSILVLVGICFFVMPGTIVFNSNLESYFNEPNVSMFSVFSVGAAVLSFYLFGLIRGQLIARPMNRTDFLYQLKETRNDQGRPVYGQSELDFLATLDDTSLKLFRLQVDMLTPYLLRWALTEIIAVLGLLLGQTTQNKAISIPFFAVAIILMLVYFPKSELENRMR